MLTRSELIERELVFYIRDVLKSRAISDNAFGIMYFGCKHGGVTWRQCYQWGEGQRPRKVTLSEAIGMLEFLNIDPVEGMLAAIRRAERILFLRQAKKYELQYNDKRLQERLDDESGNTTIPEGETTFNDHTPDDAPADSGCTDKDC